MIDKAKFMETLRSVQEIAKVSEQPLTRKEVDKYFSDMELTKEQEDMVYAYLLKPQEEEPVSEESAKEPVEEDAEKESEVENKPEVEHSALGKLYKQELGTLSSCTDDELVDLYKELLAGNDVAAKKLTECWLPHVVKIAEGYAKEKVNLDDLMQEGNIGLLGAINHLLGSNEKIDVEDYLNDAIKKSIEMYIDEMIEEDDRESTMLAKATLVHEAQKALAKDMGRVPTRKELADFTKLSEDEIEDILSLSKED